MTDRRQGRGVPEPDAPAKGSHPVDPETVREVAVFRRAARERLMQARALSSQDREAATGALLDGLGRIISCKPDLAIAAYWPIRGEPDIRPWMKRAVAAGVRILLPVVVEKAAPLEFHRWTPDSRMTRGFWNILEPADGLPDTPDIVISPLVGIDDDLYRLGNGGGYYDRTLVGMSAQTRIIGVGFSGCRLPTIRPMPWDIPMTEALLSDGTHLRR